MSRRPTRNEQRLRQAEEAYGHALMHYMFSKGTPSEVAISRACVERLLRMMELKRVLAVQEEAVR